MLLSPKTPDPAATSAHDEALRRQDSSVAQLSDTVTTEVRHFDFLRGLTEDDLLARLRDPESFLPECREALQDLQQILALTKDSMTQMNESYPGLPPDTVSKTLDLVSRPGSSVVVLKGRDPNDPTTSLEVLGYGIVIRGKENFPDASNIPDYLMKGDTSHRLIRLFVTDTARKQLSPGNAFSRIIEKIKEISGSGPIIGMVLTDLVLRGGNEFKPEGKQIWLEAKSALEKRGFEDSEETIAEVVEEAGHVPVAIIFNWYVWPPRSEQGRELYARHQERFRKLESRQRERLAGIMPALPLAGGTVQYYGTSRDAFDTAEQFSGNLIHAQLFSASDRGANREVARANLVQNKESSVYATVSNGAAHAVVINGVLPDVANNAALDSDREKRIEVFLNKARSALRDGGFIVVRCTVGLEWDEDIVIRLNPHATYSWSNGRTLPDIFSEFVATRIESHITEEEWQRVAARGEREGMAEFLAPPAVVSEFPAKYPYVADWDTERLRSYTQHSPQQRIDQVCRGGLRLVYSGPEQSAFVRSAYRDGAVELRNQAGQSIDLPPTNYIVIAQKVAPDEGSGFSVGPYLPLDKQRFVEVHKYERIDPHTGNVVGYREVANRPHVTLDVIPYAIARGRLYIMGRMYPRPLTVVHSNLDESRNGGYLTEQLAKIVRRESLESAAGTAEAAKEFLGEKQLIDPTAVKEVGYTSRYFVRADTVDEEVVATAVLVPELPAEDRSVIEPKNNFGGRYLVRTFDAMRVLQGQQTGFLEDPRIERKIYELLLAHTIPLDPWLGATLKLAPQEGVAVKVASASQAMNLPERRVFRPAADQTCSFLAAHRREFSERLAKSESFGGRTVLEYVEPHPSTGLSHESMPILPVARRALPDGSSEIVVGLEIKDLPAAQERFGSSAMATVPTTRIPLARDGLRGARAHVAKQLRANFGIECRQLETLGGKYVVSPGVTPEVMYPMIAEVDLEHSRTDSLLWIPLRDVVPHISKLHCGQAITLLYRAAHMLGISSNS
jgi:hypothetical protein